MVGVVEMLRELRGWFASVSDAPAWVSGVGRVGDVLEWVAC